jgi:GWxTD domain-containing protein
MVSKSGRLLASLGLIACLGACASTGVVRELDPESREFYSKVRYIITNEEKKAFLALPEEARPAFIEDFWERRDPTPGTEENEYKTEYFNRIDTANRLFSGGGAPGWLQDRGRIYITLGPPDHREVYPRGVTFYGVPTEYWWYGFFPIRFVDERWVDDYRIDPDDATQISQITQAQTQWNLPPEGLPKSALTWNRALPGLDVQVEKADGEGARITLSLPYRNIWMKAQGDRLEAALEVTIEVRDAAGEAAWSFAQTYPLSLATDRLKEALADAFTAETVAPLGPGSYTLTVTVTNANDGSKASLEKVFTI